MNPTVLIARAERTGPSRQKLAFCSEAQLTFCDVHGRSFETTPASSTRGHRESSCRRDTNGAPPGLHERHGSLEVGAENHRLRRSPRRSPLAQGAIRASRKCRVWAHRWRKAQRAAGRGAAAVSAGRATVAVARQPILDRNGSLIGYELLFREPNSETAGVLDDRAATSTVILDGLFDVGLFDLVGDNVAYLNVSRDFLLSVRPLPLPARRVVLELLEDQIVDDALLGVLEELVADGFTIALDDFRLTPATERLIRYASIVKLDVLEHTGRAFGISSRT